MSDLKAFLNADDFRQGLEELDKEMANDPYLVAFAPIEILTAGGFLAVWYLKSREATGDLDYIIHPEWSTDDEIKEPFHEAVLKVGKKLNFNRKWMNEDMKLFTTGATDERLFKQSQEENLVLFSGNNILVRAAPIEWALERKLRRIYAGGRDRKAEFDLSDAVAMLKNLKDTKGPLDREYIRTLNMNGFDVVPDDHTMNRVAVEFQRVYGEEAFA
ncbi:uncharacterized protein EAE97_002410 [Botrytis byssoidea]|uniref:DUF7582 domain-containing protein n=1 Tax=Botrytis byssoidea TaxID=139641 RepID=A0A9P5IR41_9HELO|nr:uncharacterized protein EAE97_002410 [Botrytis byssoidea]KAF7950858.1 hypothetical protein EAE97_002410 [Botrytis byssoidea]